jgi:hypothetical protein
VIINKRARGARVVVGVLDVTNYLAGLEYGLSATDPQSPLLWSGTLTLSEELGAQAAFSFDDRGDGLSENPLWVRGTVVTVYVKDFSGVERLSRTLRILRSFYEEESGTLTIELGCLLNLANNRSQPADASNVVSGTPQPRIDAIAATLVAANISNLAIAKSDYLAGDLIDFPLIKANGSFVQVVQKALAPEQHFAWVDSEEKIRFKFFSVPAAPLISRERSDFEEIKRESVAEILPKFVRSVGSKIVYSLAQVVPVNTTQDTTNLGSQQNPNYYAARASAGIAVPNQNLSFVSQRIVNTFTGDYSTSTVQTTDTYYSRVSMGFGTGTNKGSGGYLFFQINGFGQSAGSLTGQEEALEKELVLARRVKTTTFYGINKEVVRIVNETFVARDQLALHYAAYTVQNPPVTAFQEELLTLLTADTAYTNDPATLLVTSTEVTTCELQYGTSTDDPPVAGNEFLQCSTTTTSGGTTAISYGPPGVQKETPLTCSFQISGTGLGAREKEVTLEYSSNNDQHCRYAALVATLLIGRKLGYEIALEPTDDLLFNFVPFLRIDVSTNSVNRKYLIDSPSFGFTTTEASFRCSGIAVEVS